MHGCLACTARRWRTVSHTSTPGVHPVIGSNSGVWASLFSFRCQAHVSFQHPRPRPRTHQRGGGGLHAVEQGRPRGPALRDRKEGAGTHSAGGGGRRAGGCRLRLLMQRRTSMQRPQSNLQHCRGARGSTGHGDSFTPNLRSLGSRDSHSGVPRSCAPAPRPSSVRHGGIHGGGRAFVRGQQRGGPLQPCPQQAAGGAAYVPASRLAGRQQRSPLPYLIPPVTHHQRILHGHVVPQLVQ